MASKKLVLFSLLGLLILGGSISWDLHRASVQQAQQKKQADKVLSVVVQEGKNCLKKLAGSHDSIEPVETSFQTKISSCYLQNMRIEVSNTSEDACLGLTQYLTDSDYFHISAVKTENEPLTAETCGDGISLRFELTTTTAGINFYEKERKNNQTDKKDSTQVMAPTLEGLADTNAFPEEIIERLNRKAANQK